MTPFALHEALKPVIAETGRRIVIDFDSDENGMEMTAKLEGVGPELGEEQRAQALELALLALQQEIEGFHAKSRCSGRILIDQVEIFMTGDSQDNDWAYDCSIEFYEEDAPAGFEP